MTSAQVVGQTSNVSVMFISSRPLLLENFHWLAFLGLSSGRRLRRTRRHICLCLVAAPATVSAIASNTFWVEPLHLQFFLPRSPLMLLSAPPPRPLQCSITVCALRESVVHRYGLGIHGVLSVLQVLRPHLRSCATSAHSDPSAGITSSPRGCSS